MENKVKIEDLKMVIKRAKELRDTLKIWDYKDEEMYTIPGMFLNSFEFVTREFTDVMECIIKENIERLEIEKELEEDEEEDYEIMFPIGVLTSKGNIIIFDDKKDKVKIKCKDDEEYITLCKLEDIYEVRSYKDDGTIAIDVHNHECGLDTFYINEWGIEI